MNYRFPAALLLLLTWLPPPMVCAAEQPVAPSAAFSPPASTTLRGSLKAIDVEAGEGLRQMGSCLKKMERAALELMGEATRQDYIAVGDPDVVGTIIVPAIPAPSGMMPVGDYLPIRRRWMDYYLGQIGHLMPMYAEMADSLIVPGSIKANANLLLEQMRPLYVDAKKHYLQLLAMSRSLKHNKNDAVAFESVKLHDDMEKMEKLRHDVFNLLKDSEKKSGD